ncbi:MAG: hypothetical protein P8M73_12105 [Luminiphilus sp.]|jgi:hypothetical protein|nr:hypothetical protein [Luminiphilus sp.]
MNRARCSSLIIRALHYLTSALGLASLILLINHNAYAQSESGWSNQGLIYLLGPTLDGTSGVGPVDTEVDLSASDVLDAIDGGFLGMYRGEGARWGVLVDVVYMDLKADGTGASGVLSGEVEVEQTSAILSATFRVSPTTQLMAGALYNDVSAGISLTGPQDTVRTQEMGEEWIDPMVGVLFETPIGTGKWSFSGAAQVGGFGVGSDLVTILTGSFSYHFNEWSSVDIGYRYLDFDYEDGDGADRFKFDMKEHGPAIGWRFDF